MVHQLHIARNPTNLSPFRLSLNLGPKLQLCLSLWGALLLASFFL